MRSVSGAFEGASRYLGARGSGAALHVATAGYRGSGPLTTTATRMLHATSMGFRNSADDWKKYINTDLDFEAYRLQEEELADEPEAVPTELKHSFEQTEKVAQKLLPVGTYEELVQSLIDEGVIEPPQPEPAAPKSKKEKESKTEKVKEKASKIERGTLASKVMQGETVSSLREKRTGIPKGARGLHTLVREAAPRAKVPDTLQKFMDEQNPEDPNVKELKWLIDQARPESLEFANEFIKNEKEITCAQLKEIILYANTEMSDIPPAEPGDIEKLKSMMKQILEITTDPKKQQELKKEWQKMLKDFEPPKNLKAEELAEWKKDQEELLKILNEPNYPEKFLGSFLNIISKDILSGTKKGFLKRKTELVNHLKQFKAIEGNKHSHSAEVICKEVARAIENMTEPQQISSLFKKLYTLTEFIERNPEVLNKDVKLSKGDKGLGDVFIGLIDDLTKELKAAHVTLGSTDPYDPEAWFQFSKHFSKGDAASRLFAKFQRRDAKSVLQYRRGIVAVVGLALFVYSQLKKTSWEEQKEAVNACDAKAEKMVDKIAVDNMLTDCILNEIRENSERSADAVDTQEKIQNLGHQPIIRDFLSLMGEQAILDFVSGDHTHTLEEYIQLNKDKINRNKRKGTDPAQSLLDQLKKDENEIIKEYFELRRKGRELNPENKTFGQLLKANEKNLENIEKMIPLEREHKTINEEALKLKKVTSEIKYIQDHRPDVSFRPFSFLLDNIFNRTDKKLSEVINGEDAQGKKLIDQLAQCQKSEEELLERILDQSPKKLPPSKHLEFKNRVLARMSDRLDEMILNASSEVEKMDLKNLKQNINKEMTENRSHTLKEYIHSQPFFRRTP